MTKIKLRHHTHIAVYLILYRRGTVLLLRRANTGYQDGKYSLIAGHVERDESLKDAVQREAREEVGITIAKKDLKIGFLNHRYATDKKLYLDIFFTCSKWTGIPKNRETSKCDDLSWHPLLKLPKNTIIHVKKALTSSKRTGSSLIPYVESGFNK